MGVSGGVFCQVNHRVRRARPSVAELDPVVQLGNLGLVAGHLYGHASALPVGFQGWGQNYFRGFGQEVQGCFDGGCFGGGEYLASAVAEDDL